VGFEIFGILRRNASDQSSWYWIFSTDARRQDRSGCCERNG